MLGKLSLPLLAALLLFCVVLVFAVAMAIMLVRQIPIPEWLRQGIAPLVTLLMGLVLPQPKLGEQPKDGAP